MNKDFLKNIDRLFSTRIFHAKDILVISFSFAALVIFSNIVVKLIRRIVEFDCPNYWPISVITPRIPGWKELLVAISSLFLFHFTIRYLLRLKYNIYSVILVGIILVLATNMIQGWEDGFISPIARGGIGGHEYFHDAKKIKDPSHFIIHFEQVQSVLQTHSRTHPPGVVLTIYLLLKIFEDPGFISVVIAVVSVFLSTFFLHGVLSTEFAGHDHSGYMSFLFILIPSVQIYYAASIDALVASFLLGVLYFFIHPRASISIIGAVLLLFCASFLTFGFVFILPVIFGFEIVRKGHIWKSCLILLGLTLIYIIICAVFNFNYINSFIIASTLENPLGFRLFIEPISYIFSRLEGIFEITLFFGPFLCVVMLRGLRIMKNTHSHLGTMTWLAIATLLAMFITGAFHTGETSRICLFIYPYMIFPIASYLSYIKISIKEKNTLLSLVFIQTVFMQLFGDYSW